MAVNEPTVELEEVVSVLTPAEGVTIDQALADAGLEGYQQLEIDREKNIATITWFKKKES